MKNLETIIDDFVDKLKEEEPCTKCEYHIGYNEALEDLKSYKQELIEGIVEITWDYITKAFKDGSASKNELVRSLKGK